MLITYEIEYDPEKREYFLPLSAKDNLIIHAPFWLQLKFTPSYYFNDKPLVISKNKNKPSQLTLSSGETIDMYQISWASWKDVLPKYKVNGITSSVKQNFALWERALILLPLALTIPAGSLGFFIGSLAVGLNLSLIHVDWPKWQRSTAMAFTTCMAATIALTGMSTILHQYDSHIKKQPRPEVIKQSLQESLYTNEEQEI